MKTQVIATLAKYYYNDLGKKVLLVTPQTKPRDELIKRIKKCYNIDVSTKLGQGRLQAMITQGLMNKKDIKDPNKEKDIISELESFDVVLVDEVEYVLILEVSIYLVMQKMLKYDTDFQGLQIKAVRS